jgi:hypothetical protein
MQTLAEFRPTPMDETQAMRHFAVVSDRLDWLVLPVMRAQSTDLLGRSNFEVALRRLGAGEEALTGAATVVTPDVEIRRFNHWAPGMAWFEVVLVRPDSAVAAKAEEIEADLADCPLLDEEDYSRREREAYDEEWADPMFISLLENSLAQCVPGVPEDTLEVLFFDLSGETEIVAPLLRSLFESVLDEQEGQSWFDPDEPGRPNTMGFIARVSADQVEAFVVQAKAAVDKAHGIVADPDENPDAGDARQSDLGL